jgi:hypothetical protein
MKSLLKYIAFLLIIGLFTLSACDPNENVDPDQDVRASYLGTWNCQEDFNYDVTVQLDASNTAQILIYNFHMQGGAERVYCIATSNNLTLPSQNICGKTVNGTGNLVNNNRFTMRYYVNDQADLDTVNAVYTK